ncbi:RteC domain-containing protein [Galbibacter sp. EGI 63066]|uniref:RteC domain-containing protein n=1 Tax=Galbibacter sp. EGI 63066 TaxID=2993559 RepID=UPI002248DB14|nr:RteC domain-containing protein [Galbibacter sp. EGI 63066]MCX2679626.1 RteC domain-containing protein [Galbibacter sp. EGI 63066]
MTNSIYQEALERIKSKEKNVSFYSDNIIDETYKMIIFTKDLLNELKTHVLRQGFSDMREEISFFKQIKPKILGKLVYYNKLSRIETTRPVSNGKLYNTYYSNHMKDLKREFKVHILNSNFYRYYRSGRTDKDEIYFRLGHINFYDGLNSFVFEIDTHFSTYYDYKIARIIANELLYTYLLSKIEPYNHPGTLTTVMPFENGKVRWTDSKNALIELLYALHVTGSISNGRISLKKLSILFQELFSVQLGDIHHAFHRMKDRADDRTIFLNHLKKSLEQYMDKNL